MPKGKFTNLYRRMFFMLIADLFYRSAFNITSPPQRIWICREFFRRDSDFVCESTCKSFMAVEYKIKCYINHFFFSTSQSMSTGSQPLLPNIFKERYACFIFNIRAIWYLEYPTSFAMSLSVMCSCICFDIYDLICTTKNFIVFSPLKSILPWFWFFSWP